MKQVSRLENLFFDRKLGLSETLLIGFDKLVFFYLKKQTNKTKTKRKTKQNKQTKQVLISIRKANLVPDQKSLYVLILHILVVFPQKSGLIGLSCRELESRFCFHRTLAHTQIDCTHCVK